MTFSKLHILHQVDTFSKIESQPKIIPKLQQKNQKIVAGLLIFDFISNSKCCILKVILEVKFSS